jgi:hypothetical protein
MTAALRARAREMAEVLTIGVRGSCDTQSDDSLCRMFESALLRFAADALRAEPDEGEAKAGAETIAVLTLANPDTPMGVEANQVFRAMAEVRARSLTDE